MLSMLSCRSTAQGSDVDEIELTGPCPMSILSGLADQLDHTSDDGVEFAMKTKELEGTFSTGGVTLQHGGAK
jgi:hypothetical protein